MKTKITLLLTFLVSFGNLNAQITLEKTGVSNSFNYEISFYDNDGNTKFIKSDAYYKQNGVVQGNGSTIEILNEDLSVYKTVKFPISLIDTSKYSTVRIELKDFGFIDPQGTERNIYATTNYFNSDAKIEFLIRYEYYNSNNDDITFCKLINEDGVVIKTFGNTPFGLGNSGRFVVSGGYTNKSDSLFIAKPGILPCYTCKSQTAGMSPITPSTKLLDIQSVPNPTNGFVTLNYTLPENVTEGQIFFYSQQGEKLKEFKVHNDINQIGFHTGEYSPGIYFYELVANGLTSGGKKMVVIK